MQGMSAAYGISWDDRKTRGVSLSISWDDRKRRVAALAVAGMFAVLFAGAVNSAMVAVPRFTSVVVRAEPGQGNTVDRLLQSVGGQVAQHIGLINSVVADVPSGALPALSASSAVAEVTVNGHVRLLGSTYDPTSDVDSLYNVEQMDGARAYWKAGYTGQGVDVALIDSGVTPVNGLHAAGKVLNGPDLSFESQNSSQRYLDTFGHGTHMAGIIAGRDDGVSSVSATDTTHFLGVAPDARIVSLKVADAHGQTDVSQMLAAIDWVVQHKSDSGLNIRVLNLSFGTDSTQSYQLDPLAYAVEQAWRQGIVVVVSAGNEGNNSNGLEDPAIDPYVIAVGAADTENTTNVGAHDPASFTSEGDGTRNPDFSAPGVHIASLRVPGSFIDQQYGETATVGTRFFRGSGTSQAAAVVSGAAALLLSQRPSLTPDQVKALLAGHTKSMKGNPALKGKGELNLGAVLSAPTPNSTQSWSTSSGNGSLEASRGTRHVTDANGNRLTGEQDIFGRALSTRSLASAEQNACAWNGGVFNGSTWTGSSWSGSGWSGASWSSGSWSGASWSGASWSGASWSGASWSGASWSGASWSGASWSGSSWSSDDWS
jgi:serine protease AprX